MPKQPYRVVTIICESFNRYDAVGYEQAFLDAGFQVFGDFDLAPTGNSGTSFVCMDSEEAWDPEASAKNPWTPAFRERVPAIEEKDKWISNLVSTKFFTPAWPRKWDITSLDPEREPSDSCALDCPMEPEIPIYPRFLDFLESRFYDSDYRRVIYWSLIGHVKCRVGTENVGIPHSLEQSFSRWADLILEEILPRIDLGNTVVMVHPDHGTRRKGRPLVESVHHGWLWIHHPELAVGKSHDRKVTWKDYRRTLLDIFALDELAQRNDGDSVLAR